MSFDQKNESEQFDKAADYYDQYRPSYPKKIIRQFVEQAQLGQQSKVLEIGAGSGKATELIKEYGFFIQCIEPGENLVRRGREKFGKDKNVTFECVRFEQMKDTGKRYDAIFAAQSFHWLPQPVGFQKCAEFLKADGYLALLWNMYLYDEREEHQKLLQLSKQYGGFADFVTRQEAERRIKTIVSSITESGLFEEPRVEKQLWELEYSAEEYYGFVQTGNRFLQLSNEEKECAHREIIDLAKQYGERICRPYLAVLYVAKKK